MSRQQAQLLKIIKTGITENGITGVGIGTRGAATNDFRDNRNWDKELMALGQVNFGITETDEITGVHSS
jgi:hypothetical protein